MKLDLPKEWFEKHLEDEDCEVGAGNLEFFMEKLMEEENKPILKDEPKAGEILEKDNTIVPVVKEIVNDKFLSGDGTTLLEEGENNIEIE